MDNLRPAHSVQVLTEILKELQSNAAVVSGSSDASAANQISEILYSTYNVWDKIPGRSKVFSYYGGIVAGNPSGNVTNISTIQFRIGATIVLSQTFTYDSTDKILTITAS